ncbi:MAG TPA: CxxC-x17-CxxC domain-containing protein [Candidatus Nanoarchaeia archaeon]|nr:CxxC-x17-CxxC domain-containing protein [Candidatus Nanoarchaeia archaeon]
MRENKSPRRDFGKRDFNRGGNDSGPMEKHKIKCNDCGKESTVPFKPREGKPVYCRECYSNHRPQRF